MDTNIQIDGLVTYVVIPVSRLKFKQTQNISVFIRFKLYLHNLTSY